MRILYGREGHYDFNWTWNESFLLFLLLLSAYLIVGVYHLDEIGQSHG